MASLTPTEVTQVLGGWQPIDNVKCNRHVQDLGRFVVAENNKEQQADIMFVQVVEAQSQVVAGTNYSMLIKTFDSELVRFFKALVWEKPWEHAKIKMSFVPVLP